MRPHDQKLLHRVLPASSPTRLLALLMPLALAACAEAVPDKGADEGAIPNSPPGAPTVLLSPAAPTTTQDVAVVIVAEAVDPDGDAVSYRYLWLEDGAVRDDLTAATLPAAETRKGQVWTVSVIATDGELDGGVGEASATVVNTPPVASVSLPSAPDTEDDLVADAAGVDDDGDPVSLRYAWTVDGVASTWAEATVPASATARGQVWAVTVTPNDGEEDGVAVSAEVTIANTVPVADLVSLTPSPAFENSVLQAVIAGAADVDGDPITPAYTWLVNGVAVSGEAADTLSGAVFDKGDTVQVRVELSDGVGVGATLSSEALTIVNSAPTGAAPSISPLPVYEATTASCAPAGWADVDGDAESWQISWEVNGLATATGASLTGASFAKGDQLVCVATPDDGEALGIPLSSTPVTVSNTPPSLASATLSTLSPTEATTLSVSLGATADADGDPVSVGYAWSVNGALVSAGATLAPSRFAKGDTVQVVVTPYDGADFGAAVASAPAVVANTAPTVGVVSLSPSSVRTDGTLTASATGADVDGDSVTLAYDWQVNGVPVGGSGASLSGALYFDKGDVVQVTVTPYDGAAFGASRSSSTVTVLNSTPTAPVVGISPADPVEGEALVCEVLTASADADSDLVNYTFTWEVDGVAYADAGSTVRAGDTVLAGETFAGEEWTCAAVGSDGSASSAAAEASLTVEGDCGDGSVSLTASGIDFVTVCADTFSMGCTPGQSGCEGDESPVRPTTLTRDYLMSRTEVTQGQFAAVMGYSPSSFTSCGSTCPVENVSWHEAARFANAVSTAAGLAACYTCSGSGSSVTCSAPSSVYSCAGYRLPTEAEWEGAARCGEDLLYAGSNTIGAVAWYIGNSGSRTRPVASLAPNTCGLYDMSGNVWEWTNDWYSSSAYGGGAATDPTGPSSGSVRVIRGGSWSLGPEVARIARRGDSAPGARGNNLGLRLVRTAP